MLKKFAKELLVALLVAIGYTVPVMTVALVLKWPAGWVLMFIIVYSGLYCTAMLALDGVSPRRAWAVIVG